MNPQHQLALGELALPRDPGRFTVFGDQAVAATMIDRIVHHAEVVTLKGASYRLRGRGIRSLPSTRIDISDPAD